MKGIISFIIVCLAIAAWAYIPAIVDFLDGEEESKRWEEENDGKKKRR